MPTFPVAMLNVRTTRDVLARLAADEAGIFSPHAWARTGSES